MKYLKNFDSDKLKGKMVNVDFKIFHQTWDEKPLALITDYKIHKIIGDYIEIIAKGYKYDFLIDYGWDFNFKNRKKKGWVPFNDFDSKKIMKIPKKSVQDGTKRIKVLRNFIIKEYLEYSGLNTKWDDLDIINVIKYLDNNKIPVEYIDTQSIEYLLIDVERDPNRVKNSNIDFPIIISEKDGEYKKIVDGQHRLVKCLNNDIKKIKARILNLDNSPEEFNIFENTNFEWNKKPKKLPEAEYSEPFEGFTGKIYFIAPDKNREKKPWTKTYVVGDFKIAYETWQNIQRTHNYNYGIYEADIKPLSKEEIEERKNIEKYNL